eukprot:TRINITY_DN2192_c0_g2_i1.p1 TRINITY_DN2192_c0_g2~~TRINITY_DN2192_c0_g2_i1.p1  ORF type:complete len:203 (+),score=36.45 TRINITY_DN2192_c0_g2_i1:23-610(+)
MDLIVGDDLNELVKKDGPWKSEQVKPFLLQLLAVLRFVHDKDILHRDIKPHNVMQRRADGKFFLIDFGIAATNIQDEDFAQSRVGTNGYAPPEMSALGWSRAGDIYSLGATALFLLTGQHPRQIRPLLEGAKRGCESELHAAISVMLEFDPRNRIQGLVRYKGNPYTAGAAVGLTTSNDMSNSTEHRNGKECIVQ